MWDLLCHSILIQHDWIENWVHISVVEIYANMTGVYKFGIHGTPYIAAPLGSVMGMRRMTIHKKNTVHRGPIPGFTGVPPGSRFGESTGVPLRFAKI